MIQIKQFYGHNVLRNFSYLIFDDVSGSAWVIDPWASAPVEEYIKKNSLELKGILNTHHHFDHVRGNDRLHEVFGSPIKKLRGGETIELDHGHRLVTIDSPGHTLDHQVFVCESKGEAPALFSGDTLFNGGVGNCRDRGNVDKLYSTVRSLIEKLPKETKLYPGHDYIERNLLFAETLEKENQIIKENLRKVKDEDPENREVRTLADELSYNPFLRLDSREIQSFLTRYRPLDDSAEKERELFKRIRSIRDRW